MLALILIAMLAFAYSNQPLISLESFQTIEASNLINLQEVQHPTIQNIAIYANDVFGDIIIWISGRDDIIFNMTKWVYIVDFEKFLNSCFESLNFTEITLPDSLNITIYGEQTGTETNGTLVDATACDVFDKSDVPVVHINVTEFNIVNEGSGVNQDLVENSCSENQAVVSELPSPILTLSMFALVTLATASTLKKMRKTKTNS